MCLLENDCELLRCSTLAPVQCRPISSKCLVSENRIFMRIVIINYPIHPLPLQLSEVYFHVLLIVHVLAALVWTGGHLVLELRVLP